MTPKELAALLTGREYRSEITREEAAQAKADGLVVVFGASDDLVEFRGAIDDEISFYNGGFMSVDKMGPLEPWEEDDLLSKAAARAWFKREPNAREIKVCWCDDPPYSWTFKTEIPHETFEVMEDGEPFCRGIVFALDALP